MTETSLMTGKITSRNHLESILEQKPELLLVLFYSPSSEKSLVSLGALEKLKETHNELNVYSVNVSEVRDVHLFFNVSSVPTLIVFRNGNQAEVINGVQTEGFYAQILRKRTRSQDEDQPSHRVTVYSTPTCPYCTSVKQYLDSKNIFYDEVDVAADPSAAQELVNRTGQQGVPQTEIDGSFVIGFNTKELDRLLEQ